MRLAQRSNPTTWRPSVRIFLTPPNFRCKRHDVILSTWKCLFIHAWDSCSWRSSVSFYCVVFLHPPHRTLTCCLLNCSPASDWLDCSLPSGLLACSLARLLACSPVSGSIHRRDNSGSYWGSVHRGHQVQYQSGERDLTAPDFQVVLLPVCVQVLQGEALPSHSR